MELREMFRALRENNLPRRAVAVTFDDGYADSLYKAKPLLERYNIPATVYVCSGCVDTSRKFVHDTLEPLFLQPACSNSEGLDKFCLSVKRMAERSACEPLPFSSSEAQ